ncbi:MAG: hypothetical protein L3J43_06790 [Sulfurovum sp.]|nr:hypothetical protein [Sulfurovum sp.]
MKKTILVFTLITTVHYADLSMDQIRGMVQKIHDRREGISLDKLRETREPFVRLEEENNTTKFVIPVDNKESKLSLNAIINKMAYINGEWKGIDDEISGFTLKYVGKKGVVLRNDNQIKKLFLDIKRENFITIKEGK